jgi:hypothetical protein
MYDIDICSLMNPYKCLKKDLIVLFLISHFFCISVCYNDSNTTALLMFLLMMTMISKTKNDIGMKLIWLTFISTLIFFLLLVLELLSMCSSFSVLLSSSLFDCVVHSYFARLSFTLHAQEDIRHSQ